MQAGHHGPSALSVRARTWKLRLLGIALCWRLFFRRSDKAGRICNAKLDVLAIIRFKSETLEYSNRARGLLSEGHCVNGVCSECNPAGVINPVYRLPTIQPREWYERALRNPLDGESEMIRYFDSHCFKFGSISSRVVCCGCRSSFHMFKIGNVPLVGIAGSGVSQTSLYVSLPRLCPSDREHSHNYHEKMSSGWIEHAMIERRLRTNRV